VCQREFGSDTALTKHRRYCLAKSNQSTTTAQSTTTTRSVYDVYANMMRAQQAATGNGVPMSLLTFAHPLMQQQQQQQQHMQQYLHAYVQQQQVCLRACAHVHGMRVQAMLLSAAIAAQQQPRAAGGSDGDVSPHSLSANTQHTTASEPSPVNEHRQRVNGKKGMNPYKYPVYSLQQLIRHNRIAQMVARVRQVQMAAEERLIYANVRRLTSNRT
jgi:hypothetical protein